MPRIPKIKHKINGGCNDPIETRQHNAEAIEHRQQSKPNAPCSFVNPLETALQQCVFL